VCATSAAAPTTNVAMWCWAQTSDALRSTLVDIGMESFARPLEDLGVTEISDMMWVTDKELNDVGIRPVQVRKIRNATMPPAPVEPEHETASNSGPLRPSSRLDKHKVRNMVLPATINRSAAADRAPSAAADAPNHDTTDRAAAAEAAAMVQCTHEVQVATSNALGVTLKMAVSIGGYNTIMHNIVFAKAYIDVIDSSPKIAADGFIAVSRVLASLPGADPIYASMAQARKLSRDYLIWRTQLSTRIGDRVSFIQNLMLALSAKELRGDFFSHLMHSHSKEVLYYHY
jgi:hypothetical protein